MGAIAKNGYNLKTFWVKVKLPSENLKFGIADDFHGKFKKNTQNFRKSGGTSRWSKFGHFLQEVNLPSENMKFEITYDLLGNCGLSPQIFRKSWGTVTGLY